MWFLISGVLRRKLPWWFLASPETWNELPKKFLHHNYKAAIRQVKGRTNAVQYPKHESHFHHDKH